MGRWGDGGGVVLLLGVSGTQGQEAPLPPCEGKYKGKTLSPDELATVLTTHAAWVVSTVHDLDSQKVKEDTPDERRANLCGARLFGPHLQEANLREANLQGAYLSGANLQKAYLDGANLQKVFFEPLSEFLPIISFAAQAHGLSDITFNLPFAAFTLREAFKKEGLREQQRQLTRAINYTQTRHALKSGDMSEKIDAVFKWGMFEKTCEYGWFPGRPLRILGFFLLVFAIPYGVALSTHGSAGIWAVWLPDRVHKREGQEDPVRVTGEFLFSRFTGTRWASLARRLRLLGIALYFSLLSAFQIGWREFNVGTWISRLQPREYTLRATGWVRVVSGFQSLISVYLLALWALTYFGNPFE